MSDPCRTFEPAHGEIITPKKPVRLRDLLFAKCSCRSIMPPSTMGIESGPNGRNNQENRGELEFRENLRSIMGASLTPENISTYFDNALREIVDLVDGVKHEYERTHQEKNLTPTEQEDRAFAHFKLQAIPEILALIQKKQDEISEVNNWLQSNTETVPHVIVPPMEQRGGIPRGAGTFEQPDILNRLKTLLYILKDDGINLDEVHTQKGQLNDAMMRKMSYVSVDIPSLNRLALVCDEEGNVSYFFDAKRLAEKINNPNDILSMTKEEINALLQETTELGTKLRYSASWTEDVRELLNGTLEYRPRRQNANEQAPWTSISELDPWRGFYEKDAEHYGSIATIAAKLNLTHGTIQKSLDIDPLPSVRILSGSRQKPANGYSYETIRNRFSAFLALPAAAIYGEWEGFIEVKDELTGNIEHFASARTIGNRSGINDLRIRRALKELQLPIVKMRTVSGHEVEGISYEKVAAAFAGYIDLPRAAESGEWRHFYEKEGVHYGAVGPIKNKLDANFSVIKRIIQDANLGSLRIESEQGKPVDSYPYETVVKLHDAYLALPTVAKDGEWKEFYERDGKHFGPLGTVAKRLRVSAGALRARIEGVDNLETLTVRDFIGRPMMAYALEDIEQFSRGLRQIN